MAHPGGHASAAVSLCLADESGKSPEHNEIGTPGPAISPAANSQPAPYDCVTSGDTQVSALHPCREGSATNAGTSGSVRQKDTDSPAIRPEPSTQPQQAGEGASQVLETPEAAGSGPSDLASAISQLPARLRHIKFSGEGHLKPIFGMPHVCAET